MEVPVYYINLAHRQDRRAHVEGELARIGLIGHRIEAVTTSELTDKHLRAFCRPHRAAGLQPVELATILSHMRAYSALLASGAERGLILEDDACLSVDLPAFLRDVAAQRAVPDLIKCDTVRNGQRLRSRGIGFLDNRLECLHLGTATWSSAGYLISKRLATNMLEQTDRLRDAIDNLLFNPFGVLHGLVDPYQLKPGLIAALDHLSSTAPAAASNIADAREETVRAPESLRKKVENLRVNLCYEWNATPTRFFQYFVWRDDKQIVPLVQDLQARAGRDEARPGGS